jgi:hypothetical protein
MAAIGATGAAGSGLAPGQFLTLFGVDRRDVTGAAAWIESPRHRRSLQIAVVHTPGDDAMHPARPFTRSRR